MAAATYTTARREGTHLLEVITGTKPTSGIEAGTDYTDLNGVVWRYNGTAWVAIAEASIGPVTVGTVDQGLAGASPWLVDSSSTPGWSFANIVLAAPTTTAVKGSAGVLHSLVINKPVVSAVITIYNNTAGSGAKIATITLPATLLAEGPYSAIYDVAFSVGLTIVTATGACDITVAYR